MEPCGQLNRVVQLKRLNHNNRHDANLSAISFALA